MSDAQVTLAERISVSLQDHAELLLALCCVARRPGIWQDVMPAMIAAGRPTPADDISELQTVACCLGEIATSDPTHPTLEEAVDDALEGVPIGEPPEEAREVMLALATLVAVIEHPAVWPRARASLIQLWRLRPDEDMEWLRHYSRPRH